MYFCILSIQTGWINTILEKKQKYKYIFDFATLLLYKWKIIFYVEFIFWKEILVHVFQV